LDGEIGKEIRSGKVFEIGREVNYKKGRGRKMHIGMREGK
jgi:hypothetical protein